MLSVRDLLGGGDEEGVVSFLVFIVVIVDDDGAGVLIDLLTSKCNTRDACATISSVVVVPALVSRFNDRAALVDDSRLVDFGVLLSALVGSMTLSDADDDILMS